MNGFRRAFMGSAIAVGAVFVITDLIHAAPPACDPDNGGIKLHDGFCATVAADNHGPARHLTVASNGDVYVAIQQNRTDTAGIVALRDTDGDGKFDQKELITAGGGGT